ncbi:hypothetical protein CFC21_074811 [Triticum aestivum]|uniref:non-specific serine/threonine protein kinase n=2 Tax=Triticum aestivum TaxID=4565 RepID=A0A3B6LXR4_WHEAT|nr:hypothetical protein CFC21_074811 [Triticum aestivum]
MEYKVCTRSDLEKMLVDETAEPRDLPLSLLKDITNDFSDDLKIGSGRFSVVYKGILGDKSVAVKKLSNAYMHEREFHQEVECLMRVKHKNIVRFLGYCADTQGTMASYNGKLVMEEVHQSLLCFEYIPNGSLDKYITDAYREWRTCYKIIKGISEGLQFLHENHIIRLDLKPANILLDDSMVPKITDFRLSRCFHENQRQDITKTTLGTMGYLAPELLEGDAITCSADLYSLGAIITEILTGQKGYQATEEVLESWSDRMERSQRDTLLEQIRVCYEIALECRDFSPKKRPASGRDIVDRVREMEGIQAEMGSSLAVMSAMDDALVNSSLADIGAMNAPVSSSLGVMGPLLRKLDSLLLLGCRLRGPLKDRVVLLREDLEEISVALVEQSMVDSPNEMAKYWMNEVRELCYDIEDFIDDMMLTHADAKMRSVQSFKVGRVKIPWLPKKVRPCTRAAKFAELRAPVREAIERHGRYLDGFTSSSRSLFTVYGHIPLMYAEAANYLVGVNDANTKLVKWLTNEKEQQLKMVAITGHSGVGKTALAKQLYREVEEQFDCRAFVRASRKPDMRRLLGGILSQVQQHQCPTNSYTVQNLIDKLTEHLQNKRYVIVIDDLWETTSWDIVASAFPEGNNCSRIITTTEIEGVALECCDYQSDNILKMKPLGGEDSGKLLLNLVFGPERLCPEQLKGASDIIIAKCAGLPLATICVSGLLATQPDNPKLWLHVQEFLCSNLSTNSTLEETLHETLKLSYNSLPHYLKTCLMYLCLYPEGCTIWKFDLIKQWIAEDFICAIEGTDTAEVADSYFEELVNRGMIQPVDINYSGEVLSCTLHHVVLDLITLESTEERFITALDYSQTIRGHYSKVRRLSLHFSNPRYAKKPTGLTLSKVRSIGFFGILKCAPTIVGFKHLRVLILEFWGDQWGIMSFDLTRICRFFQLRYLKISCDASVEVELPTQMRMLRYLETLIIDAAVSAVPSDIIHLPGLLHLSLGDKTDLPDEVGRIRSLRVLHCFNLSSNSEDNVLSLGDLLNLQDLNLTYCTEESDDHLKRNLAALASSLGKLVNLKSITLAPGASGTAIYHDVWSSVSSLPFFLQRLELLPPICIFSRLPQCLGQLRKLCILTVVVSELLMEDMDILTGLPALTVFSLYVRQPTLESIIFKKRAFLGLKCFKYTCGVLSLTFQEEAFPNLQRLELSFNAHRGEQYYDFLSGIGYLLNLKEIAGTIGAAKDAEESDRRVAESAFTDAIRKHPRFPSYNHVKRVDWVHEEYQLRTQAKDSSREKYETLEKQHGRKEGDSLHEQTRILLKETGEETKQCTNSWSSYFPATESIIFDQMKSGIPIHFPFRSESYFLLEKHIHL